MDKKIMLAVAGAGKTYELCHSINKEQRNFLLAYTNENIKNIEKEVIDKAENDKVNFINATCPFVLKIHKIVSEQPENTITLIAGDGGNQKEIIRTCTDHGGAATGIGQCKSAKP